MILDELMSEREHLLQLSAKAKEDVSSAPEGRLRILPLITIIGRIPAIEMEPISKFLIKILPERWPKKNMRQTYKLI